MSQVITNAFEQYWQSCLAAEKPVVLDEFILADIPNLDITSPIDPETGLPPESQIVHRQNVNQRGRINNNAVAYTIVMDTTVGDFSFNAMYLRNKANGVIGMIVYKGRETKLKTDQTTGQTGNSLVKSMLMGYDQAAEATLTHVDAGTWQIDYAARLRGMDEDIRQLQADLYGHHTFVGDGFKVVEKDGAYQVSQGVAIVGGLRVEMKAPEVIHPGTKPIGVWVDVHRAGSLLSEHQNHFTIITSVADLADHVDSNGYQHYVAKLGTVLADSTIEDGRGKTSNGDTSIHDDLASLKKADEMLDITGFEALRRSFAEAGYNLRNRKESFGNGGVLESQFDVLLDRKTGKAYSGEGPYPRIIDAGTNPTTGGFTDRSVAFERVAYAPTIADMVVLPLVVGAVITVGGYYNVMDYSNHKRVIATADDGSGVKLENGLWANILHDGHVNLKWMGGVPLTDSKIALQASANYSYNKKVPIVLDEIFYSSASVICGVGAGGAHVAFQSTSIPTQHIGQLGGIYFTGCDGFRIVKRTTLGLSGLDIRGDGTNLIPTEYGKYLKALTFSAYRSNEDDVDRNCIVYINNCHFRQWKCAFDSSRGAWSSHYENNNITYCYQAGKHFRPHSSRFIHNTIGYCVRGFEMIEQAAGEFHNNELNTGKYTEYLIKYVKSGTSSCCSNYIEHWEKPDSVDPEANYGLGFIPIIVQCDRYQENSAVKVDHNIINVPGAYCAILYTPADDQNQHNNACNNPQPVGNVIIGTAFSDVVVASTGAGAFIVDSMDASSRRTIIKTAKLNGATGPVFFCGPNAITVYEKEYINRAEILAAVDGYMFGAADITKDTSFEGSVGGIVHSSASYNKVKIRLFVEARTDGSAATLKMAMSKFNGKSRTYEYSIPANSTVPIMIEFVQTDSWSEIQEFFFRIQSVATLPTYLRIHAVREFIQGC